MTDAGCLYVYCDQAGFRIYNDPFYTKLDDADRRKAIIALRARLDEELGVTPEAIAQRARTALNEITAAINELADTACNTADAAYSAGISIGKDGP